MIVPIEQNISPVTALPGLLAENRPAAVNQLVEEELPLLSTELENLTQELNAFIEQTNLAGENIEINKSLAQEAASIATASANYKGDWVNNFEITGYSIGMSVTFTDGYNYVSKINNNLISPITLQNTNEWNFIEAVNPNNYYLKTETYNKSEIDTNIYTKTQMSNILLSVVPAGTVIAFASSTAPTGYLKANGALISRTTYASLFAAIGTTFGAGDGSTTFALPDLRGYFPRGWADGRGIDVVSIASWSYSGTTITINTTGNHGVTVGQTVTLSGLVSTTNAPNGDTTVVTVATATSFTFTATATPTGTATVSNAKVSRAFGSNQADAYLNHSHTGSTDSQGAHSHTVGNNNNSGTGGVGVSEFANGSINTSTSSSSGAHTHTVTVNASTTGATETRPKNIALLYCIKY